MNVNKMRAPKSATPEQRFFFDRAGWSYGPGETPQAGRMRCAVELAAAESRARQEGCSFQWEIDPDIDSREFSNRRPYYALWQCLMRDASGEVVQSLHGIDFGRDKEPWGDPYRRVVEAELAAEHFA